MADTVPDPQTLALIHEASFTAPPPWSANGIAGLLDLPHIFLLTTGPAATPTGFLIGSVIAGEAELLTLAIHPDHRRRHLGAQLLMRFTKTAQSRGAETLFLEVAADNIAAIALYTNASFRETGRRPGYYHHPDGRHIDAILLSRQV